MTTLLLSVREQLSHCRPCMAHFVAERERVEQVADHLSESTGASSEKCLRFYFSRFHSEGHRS